MQHFGVIVIYLILVCVYVIQLLVKISLYLRFRYQNATLNNRLLLTTLHLVLNTTNN